MWNASSKIEKNASLCARIKKHNSIFLIFIFHPIKLSPNLAWLAEWLKLKLNLNHCDTESA